MSAKLLTYHVQNRIKSTLAELGSAGCLVDLYKNLWIVVGKPDFGSLCYGSGGSTAQRAAFDSARRAVYADLGWTFYPAELLQQLGAVASLDLGKDPTSAEYHPGASSTHLPAGYLGPLVSHVPVRMPAPFRQELIDLGFVPSTSDGEIYLILTCDRWARIAYVSGVTVKTRQGPNVADFWARLWQGISLALSSAISVGLAIGGPVGLVIGAVVAIVGTASAAVWASATASKGALIDSLRLEGMYDELVSATNQLNQIDPKKDKPRELKDTGKDPTEQKKPPPADATTSGGIGLVIGIGAAVALLFWGD